MDLAPRYMISKYLMKKCEGEMVSYNERQLLRLIWRHKGISRSEVTARMALTQQSVYRIVEQLTERGMIVQGPAKAGLGRGKPSPVLYLNGPFACCCGISLETDVVNLCLVNMAGILLERTTIALRDQSMSDVIDAIQVAIARLCENQHYLPHQLFGIGFSIAGYRISGTQFNAPLPLHEWSLIELGPLLSKRFGKPVWVENNANTAAIAENMWGIGQEIRHFAYLSFNYGLGGGLISDGELLAGGFGNAGEFSGIYEPEELTQRPALQYLLERLQQNNVPVRSIDDIHQHFDPVWPGVVEWVNEVTPAYNRLINVITAIFNPQAIVFGGQIPGALSEMLIANTVFYGKPRYGYPAPRAKLLVSDIQADASALGAAIVPFKAEIY